MTDIIAIIKGRRSIRKYTAEPVPEETITLLLEAAMAAPTASNRRPWEFVVVTEDETLAALRRSLIFGRYQAPLAIVVCGNLRVAYPGPGRGFWVEDCSAAMQNILLAASGLGLGSVWVGVYPIKPFMGAVARILGLPNHVTPLGLAYIGYPAETKPPRTQYDPKRVHWQRYQPHKMRTRERKPPQHEE
jgi:nitroreductase